MIGLLPLCHFRSINIEIDLIPNDIVHENIVGEDDCLRSNDSHEWYYLSRHTVDEVVVWRNTNLPNGEEPRQLSEKVPFILRLKIRIQMLMPQIYVRVLKFGS